MAVDWPGSSRAPFRAAVRIAAFARSETAQRRADAGGRDAAHHAPDGYFLDGRAQLPSARIASSLDGFRRAHRPGGPLAFILLTPVEEPPSASSRRSGAGGGIRS